MKRIKSWLATENKFFSQLVGDGDTFTNGEVVITNLGILAFVSILMTAEPLVNFIIAHCLGI